MRDHPEHDGGAERLNGDGLTPERRKAVMTLLRSYPQIRRAVLFGSRAMGTWRPSSDIDLALEGDGLDLPFLLKLKVGLVELNLPVEVDLLVRQGIVNPELERHIREHGVEWYAR